MGEKGAGFGFRFSMVDWQVTATTIVCEAVADEVTILIYPDWSARCTGLVKYTTTRQGSIDLVKRSLQLRKSLDCKGIDCQWVTEYRFKLQDEERRKESRAGSRK